MMTRLLTYIAIVSLLSGLVTGEQNQCYNNFPSYTFNVIQQNLITVEGKYDDNLMY